MEEDKCDFLAEMSQMELVGEQETHHSMVMSFAIFECLHKLKALQPLDIVTKTQENTPQWGKTIDQCQMKKHCISSHTMTEEDWLRKC